VVKRVRATAAGIVANAEADADLRAFRGPLPTAGGGAPFSANRLPALTGKTSTRSLARGTRVATASRELTPTAEGRALFVGTP
jgi:hypothetical protein